MSHSSVVTGWHLTSSQIPIRRPCPPGYSGSGATRCVDANGCLAPSNPKQACPAGINCLIPPTPCYPNVVCRDVPAAQDETGLKYTCGACPLGASFALPSLSHPVVLDNAAARGCYARIHLTSSPLLPVKGYAGDGITCQPCTIDISTLLPTFNGLVLPRGLEGTIFGAWHPLLSLVNFRKKGAD